MVVHVMGLFTVGMKYTYQMILMGLTHFFNNIDKKYRYISEEFIIELDSLEFDESETLVVILLYDT